MRILRSSMGATWVAATGLASLFAVAGCDTDIESSATGIDRIESTGQEIVNGIDVSDVDARNSGVVQILPNGCTGTLLNNSWVLTGAHCFVDYPDANGTMVRMDANNDGLIDNPSASRVRFGNLSDPSAQEIPASLIIKHPRAGWGSTSAVDAALIKLSRSAPGITPPFGHFTNGRMLIFGDTNATLQGAVIKSIGYGKKEALNGGSMASSGFLRYGELTITGTSPNVLGAYSNNPPTGLVCNGDSGGPAFLDVWGNGGIKARYLAGIASVGDCTMFTGYIAAAAFRDWVQATAFGAPASSITCSSGGCISLPNPLPNSTFAYQSYAPWGASRNECYYATANYIFEANYDFLYIGNEKKSGNGTVGTHWCGTLPLSLTTDYSFQSPGLVATSISRHTTKTTPPASQCNAVSGGWKGCRGTGCHACIELLNDYPKYFVNHSKCIPNTSCNNEKYLCSANCPAPTSADR